MSFDIGRRPDRASTQSNIELASGNVPINVEIREAALLALSR
jgi:hypothetical protein